jgi:HSP20 family molecular chaperone IbpA
MRFVAFSRRDPLHDLLAPHERRGRPGPEEAAGWAPAAGLLETPDRFVVSVELPSLNRGDIRIDAREQTLVPEVLPQTRRLKVD